MKNQVNSKQYLTFELDGVKYAIESTLAKEVVQWFEPTSLPEDDFSIVERYSKDCIDEKMIVLG